MTDSESCFFSNTRQRKGKGILVTENTNLGTFNMQCENLRSNNSTPQYHISYFRELLKFFLIRNYY